MRICRLDGVNRHQRQSHGGKAVILSDQMVKANDCIYKFYKRSRAGVIRRWNNARFRASSVQSGRLPVADNVRECDGQCVEHPG
ncbi:hypothetical protein CO700_22285 [Citrobacter koseri]|nr:hypothetical protein CO700_22285 [Citrobacter koseri]AVE66450.1 hypothetical protein AM351_00770 [Citrobacter koseri]PNN13532.1 hypothetical protein AL526_012865 [Citrobacter koseri]TFU38204.1 hypothetical protein E4T98_18760 [Citrobacter koseri]